MSLARVKSNPLVYLFCKKWKYSAGNRRRVVAFWCMFVCSSLISLFAHPLLWSQIISRVAREGVTESNLLTLLGLLSATLLTDIAFWSLHGPGRVMELSNAFLARVNYRLSLVRGVIGLPLGWHVDHHSGDTIDKVEKGSNGLMAFSESAFEQIYSVVRLIGSYAMLAYFCPPAAFIVLGMIAVTVWITMRFDKVLIGQYQELNKAENAISESVYDIISNITTVVILRVERAVFQALEHQVRQPYELNRRNVRLSELKWFLTNMCGTLMPILVVGTYFYQHLGVAGSLLVGQLYLLMNYLEKVTDLFFRFTGNYADVLQRRAKVANAELLTADFRPEALINHCLPPDWQELEISNLHFSYQGGAEGDRHLSDIAMRIRRGEHLALVGETGCGKTTLLRVIRDLYHPQSLCLQVDGVRVENGFEGIAQAIALVPQMPEIFATTILRNITLGAEYSPEVVKHFADLACFSEVAERLPRGYDTSIKEKGVNLSGGQQQRLALARGLLACRGKEIILLDEPTSSLDTLTEMKIYDHLFREFGEKTILATVHRLHLLPLFDRIYWFERGRIVGSGTLAELLAGNSAFRDLYEQSALQEAEET